MRRAGAGGLLYLARHEPSPSRSVAVFAQAGERADWDPGRQQRLDEPWLAQLLWHECRIQVVDRPRKDQIQIID